MKNGSVQRSVKLPVAAPSRQEPKPTKSGSDSLQKSNLPKIALSKADFKLLEKLFEADMFGLVPLQIRSKHLASLEERGLAKRASRVLSGNLSGTLPVRVDGWAITLRGHYAFCSNC